MRISPLLAIAGSAALVAPGALAAQRAGTFEVRTGVGYLFSQVSYEQGAVGFTLGATYRLPLTGTLGLGFGAATQVGGSSEVSPLCAPGAGGCSPQTLIPGTIHLGDLEVSAAPASWLLVGAGGVIAWAPGATGTTDLTVGTEGRLEARLPVAWRPRPTLGVRAVRLADRIGAVRWIGAATLGLAW